MSKINFVAILCLSLACFYLVRERAIEKSINVSLELQNKLLKDDNNAVREMLSYQTSRRTYEDGVTDTMVRLSGSDAKQQADNYINGYHAAMNDVAAAKPRELKPEPNQGDFPKKEADKLSQKD